MSRFVPVLLDNGDGGVLLNVLIYLTGKEVCITLNLCRAAVSRGCAFSDSELIYLWESIAHFAAPSSSVLKILRSQLIKQTIRNSPVTMKELAKRVYSLNNLKHLRWDKYSYETESCPRIERMEGHAAVSLKKDDGRWVAIVSGWGPHSNNELYIIDSVSLDIGRKTLRTVPTKTINNPRFRYGFSAVCTASDKVIVFGGCSVGGYSGECADMYIIQMEFSYESSLPTAVDKINKEERTETPVLQVIATYSDVLSPVGGHAPITRGYHSAVIIPLNKQENMLVFGGLHRRAPTNNLQIYNIDRNSWITEEFNITGEFPSHRFGHSCVYYPAGDNLIVSGGSNGNDLWRNGQDLQDIHVLNIVRSEQGDSLVWSTPNLWRLSSTIQKLPDRCHSASLVGSKIVMFAGGGRHNSNATFTLDLKPSDAELAAARLWMGPAATENLETMEDDEKDNNEGEEVRRQDLDSLILNSCNAMEVNTALPLQSINNSSSSSSSQSAPKQHNFLISKPILHCQEKAILENHQVVNTHFPLPSVRSCAVSIHIGRFLLIFGGWSLARSEMNDLWALDLTYGASNEYFTSAALGASFDEEDVEEDEEEEEEEEEYEDEDVRDRMDQMVQMLFMQGHTAASISQMFRTGGFMGVTTQGSALNANYNPYDENDDEDDDDENVDEDD
mmetsp:Transcript_15723/g.21599  ORF Transcript_15723/g.21599 Transcript_15723/m.21599 type:complete len:672 (-) Transcript_15723:1164-3179(-)